jgi:hypothetical protein
VNIVLEKLETVSNFIVTDLDPAYHQAIQTVGYEARPNGWFVRGFPPEAIHLERAYENAQHLLEKLLVQRSGQSAVCWEDAMYTLLRLVEGQNLDWCVVGSAALALRGLDVIPGDIDLVLPEADSLKLGELALDYLIEPMQITQEWISKWWARSFMDACVEWVGEVNDSADAQGVTDFGPMALSRLETIQWCGHAVRVPPLDLMLAVNQRRGRLDTAEKIKRALMAG